MKPQPYRHTFPDGGITAGWAYPPKDYAKWAGLVREWVRHAVERYGRSEVETWYWELWNEPNMMYWQGTPEEYHKLYDYSAEAVKAVLPSARVGGPHSTGPGDPKAAAFLRAFLEHCVRGRNYATGGAGSPLDFIGSHAKGRPQVADGHVRMGIDKHLNDIARGFEIVASFPELRGKPILIGESDPEGCAACSARTRPENVYRNTPLYACYTAAVFKNTQEAARKYGVNVRGMVTWAFEFEDQPYFGGFRTLATNGIDKPVLNVFRMLGMMGGENVEVRSSGAAGLDALLADGARSRPDIDAIAARDGNRVSVLAWKYHADDVCAPDAPVRLRIGGLPPGAARVLTRHFRIDAKHSNGYALWQEMGRPQQPSEAQYQRLERAGQLEMLSSPGWLTPRDGAIACEFALPRQAVSLVELTW